MDFEGISFTDAQGQIFLRHQPVARRQPVDVAALSGLLVLSGYAGCAVNEEAMVRAAQDCNTLSSAFVVQVAELVDAQVTVAIAHDEMSAQISFSPAQGGKKATVDDVLQALSAAGVMFGIDHAAVAQACVAGLANGIAVASGSPAVDGTDTAFEALTAKTADRAPKVDANGLIDYREHGGIHLVTAGTPLMRRIPPTPGVLGHTVRGRDLPARPGLNEMFALKMVGTQVASDDSNLLQAAVAGQPVLIHRGVQVEPVLRVAEVNLTTGNIYFDGTVQIDGEVMQGMKVQASGDIVVGGTVDGGLLEAGGDVQVAFGIIAQARVQAGGAVGARFAENCSIQAGTVITLNEMALQCTLESFNQIVIGEKSPQRGRLIGGNTTAAMLLRVPLLGSDKGDLTRVTVGANAALEREFKALEERLELEKIAEENLQKLVNQLAANGDPKGMLERVKVSWKQAVQVWSQSLAERVDLQKQLDRMLLAKLQVGMGVEGAADITLGSKTARLRKDMGKGVFSLDADQGLVFTGASGAPTPLA